jgi:hypothetical protein
MFSRTTTPSSTPGGTGHIPSSVYSVLGSAALAVLGHVLFSHAVAAEERLNVIGGLLIGILGLILFELRERSQIARLLSILEKARGDNWLIGQLDSIVDHYTAIMGRSDKLFLGRARKQLLDAVGAISDTAAGHITVPALQESVFTIELVDHCLSTMDAISIQDEAWWSTALGTQYLERHATAIKRGVKIRRVFVMPSDPAARAELCTAMSRQKEMGIDVRAVAENDLRPEQRRDIVLYDGRYFRFGDLEGDQRTARLSSNTDDIDEAKDIFEDAWLRSSDVATFSEA